MRIPARSIPKREVFTTETGEEIVIAWPGEIAATEIVDVTAWMEMCIHKFERHAAIKTVEVPQQNKGLGDDALYDVEFENMPNGCIGFRLRWRGSAWRDSCGEVVHEFGNAISWKPAALEKS